MKFKFKFKDRVFDLKYGWGSVVEVQQDTLKVKFDNKAYRVWYYSEGVRPLKQEPSLLTKKQANQRGYNEQTLFN